MRLALNTIGWIVFGALMLKFAFDASLPMSIMLAVIGIALPIVCIRWRWQSEREARTKS